MEANRSLDGIRERIPDYARDLRLNLAAVLTPEGAPGLEPRQIWSIALATAIAARNVLLAREIELLASGHLDEAHVRAAKSAAAIMGMNNVYYRFVHLVEDAEYQTLPARLRMQAIASHGIGRDDFELLSLAVSAVNGCGLCMTSHEKKLRQAGVAREPIQSAVRIAAVIHAVAGVLEFETAA
jgi:alkyl hydroperoxide reductase subunit D